MSSVSSSPKSNRPLLLGLGGAGLAGGLACLCLIVAAIAALVYFRTRPTAGDEPTAAYILDASPRMELVAEGGSGKTRIDVAEAVLAEVIRPAEPSLTMGLRVFGTGANSDTCKDTDLVVPFSPSNQARIAARLTEIVPGPSNEAALAEAMIAAIRDLSKRAGPHWLVVVTGGADTCQSDAAGLIAEEAKKAGIELQTFVIGFQLDDSEAAAVKSLIAETAGATYLAAPDQITLRSILQAVQDYINSPSDALRAAIVAAATPHSTAAVAPSTPSLLPISTPMVTSIPSLTLSVSPTGAPVSAATASSTVSPIDLNGRWEDNGQQVRITQSGNEVTALFVKPVVCEHLDGTGQTSTTDLDFTATIAGNTLTGWTTVCRWGAGNPLGVGFQMGRLKLTVSDDGLVLSGTWYDEWTQSEKPAGLTRLISP